MQLSGFLLLCLLLINMMGCDNSSSPQRTKQQSSTRLTEETDASPTDSALDLFSSASTSETEYDDAIHEPIGKGSSYGTETSFLPAAARATPMPISGKMVEAPSGSLQVRGYYAIPEKSTPTIGIVALHGRDGLTVAVQREADTLAQNNFAVLALDYYEGHQPASRANAAQMSNQYRGAPTLALIAAAQTWLKQQLGESAQILLLGWGDGGTLALQAAVGAIPPRAVITFYGDFPVEWTTVTQKLLQNNTALIGFFAQQDGWVTPARVRAFDAELSRAGVDHDFTTYATAPGFVFDSKSAGQGYALASREKIKEFLARRGSLN